MAVRVTVKLFVRVPTGVLVTVLFGVADAMKPVGVFVTVGRLVGRMAYTRVGVFVGGGTYTGDGVGVGVEVSVLVLVGTGRSVAVARYIVGVTTVGVKVGV